MSFISVINMKLIGELPSALVEEEGFNKITDELQGAMEDILKKYNMTVIEQEMVSHDLTKEHFSKCSQCSSWLIDRTLEEDREDVDPCIKNGAEFDNAILCCDCLPENNTWSWQHS